MYKIAAHLKILITYYTVMDALPLALAPQGQEQRVLNTFYCIYLIQLARRDH